MKQKFTALLLACLLVLPAGCGQEQETPGEASQEGVTQQTPPPETSQAPPAETAAPSEAEAAENPYGFVLLSDAVPDAILEIRYYSTYNFIGDRVEGYEEPCALMTKEAAQALKEVSDEVMALGYRLKVFDAYRPQTAVDHFVRWASNLEDTRMKEYFYPQVDKSSLFSQGYIARYSGHSRGSTVDLTLFDMKLGRDADMGGGFDFFDQSSHSGYTAGLTQEQIANRQLLRDVMVRHGFQPISTEWWHFTLAEEPHPDTYFSFPVSEASVTAMPG